MDLEILKKIGLSEGELKVYKALLELGITSVNKIHEKVGMDRRNIYDILNKLIEKGLISYIEENGKRTFKLASPDKILSYIEEKKSEIDSVKTEVSKIIPQMNDIYRSKKQELFAEIFRGSEGMKAVWEDLLNYDNIYWIGSGGFVPEKYPAFFEDWNKRRIKKRVKSYHLYRYEKWKIANKSWFTEAKVLPEEFSGNPVVTVVYGNKVAQMMLGENISVFVITNQELADNYKKYYKYLWDNVAKK